MASIEKKNEEHEALWELGLRSIRELETEAGILASARTEAYGCIFGRDSLITALELLRVFERTEEPYFRTVVEKTLRTLGNLQGAEVVIESGEEPGKIIHEFRPDNHEHLTALAESPWFLYPEGQMRNYDSVDATPLFLMAVHEYARVCGENSFFISLLPNVRKALSWMLEHADTDGDGFVDYRFHPERRFGGLSVQSWMDSTESLFYENTDERPPYPIAPVEVQAYAWVAMREWSDRLHEKEPEVAQMLAQRASVLKTRFNERFVLSRGGSVSLAYAIDGKGVRLTSPRSSMGHCLWATYRSEGNEPECILYPEHIAPLVRRLMSRDLFVPEAGIRTLSSRSSRFDPVSYHNGSIWPHDTAILAEGLERFGFHHEARVVREALLTAYQHFETPIELFGRARRKYLEYGDESKGACRVQAWSAGALLSVILGLRQTST